MARNKRSKVEDRWLRKHEPMRPPSSIDEVRFRPKQRRRYNYAKQLKSIQSECIESTRERLSADRGELIVTLSLSGAQFSHGVGIDPRAIDRNKMVDDVPLATDVASLEECTLCVNVVVETEVGEHRRGIFNKYHMTRSLFGIIHPVSSYPNVARGRLVQWVPYKYDPRTMWSDERHMPQHNDYANAQQCALDWLYNGEGLP